MTTKDVALRTEQGVEVQNEGNKNFDLEEIHSLDSKVIEQIKTDMLNARKLIFTVLEKDVDYGHQPGTQGMALWDSGAQTIIRAYHSHVEHKVIYHQETDDLITWTMEANVFHNFNKEIIGQGVGSSSTRETKYKYRWVKKVEALALGYSEEDISELKTRDSKSDPGVTEYRVTNPEYGDLSNTLLAMASKRSEVDAAKSLPGVAGALKILFDSKLAKEKGVDGMREASKNENFPLTPDYKRFWSMVKGMGVSEDSAHKALGVDHLEDWIKAGHTLDDGVTFIGRKLVELINKGREQPPGTATQKQEPSPEPISRKITAPSKPEEIKTVDDLVGYVNLHWSMEESEIWKTLRYKDRQSFIDVAVQTPFEAYQELLLWRQSHK